MRIARYTLGEDPAFGVVTGEPGEEVVAQVKGDPLYQQVEPTGVVTPLSEVRLLAPVIPRSKAIGIAKNYADHAAEMKGVVPDKPMGFFKPNTSVIGPDDPVVMPPITEEVGYEGELALVIGRICKDVPPERAFDVIYGYTCANDVSARDLQRGDGQWSRAKGMDGFCPLGPWIETDIDPTDLAVRTWLDGTLVQDGRTSQMVFDIPTLVAWATAAFTLLPGDVILTGTPAGVGLVEPGQVVEVEVEGIGRLRNPFVRR